LATGLVPHLWCILHHYAIEADAFSAHLALSRPVLSKSRAKWTCALRH
jgi:hypothetical protein